VGGISAFFFFPRFREKVASMATDQETSLPPALSLAPWTNVGSTTRESPLIIVSDRAALVTVLGLCEPTRFAEVYAFLAHEENDTSVAMLEAVLGPHAQQFDVSQAKERVPHILAHADELCARFVQSGNPPRLLLVVQQACAIWRRASLLETLLANSRYRHITLVLLEPSAQALAHGAHMQADMYIAPCKFWSQSEKARAFQFFCACYDRPQDFADVHKRAQTQHARLVWVNNNTYNSVSDVMRSLAVPPSLAVDELVPLWPTRHAFSPGDMTAQGRERCIARMLLSGGGGDTLVSRMQALWLARRLPHHTALQQALAASSHHQPAIAQQAHVRAHFLVIANLPAVLCDLVLDYE
jgi:hypothetical protein